MRRLYSPLRYPGGKAKVLDYIIEIIHKNYSNQKPVYIEPYAGGAAVGLGLLIEGHVSEIYINDLDPAIYSFWNCIINHHEEFIKKIENTIISVSEWKKQKEIYNESKIGFNLGFATFFLNRCNRSGVITGGCIGGLEQKSEYKIDCRFNKTNLIERIKIIAKFKNKINIFQEDTSDLLQKKQLKQLLKNCLLYLDPPYFHKGHQLYKNHYNNGEHEKLANIIKKLNGNWIISYDNVPEIKKLYADFYFKEFDLNYSAGYTKKGKEIMFFSDNIKNIPSFS